MMGEHKGVVCNSPGSGSFRCSSLNPISRSPRHSSQGDMDINAPAKAAMNRADYWGDYGLRTGMECAFGLTDPAAQGEWEVSEEERPEKWSSVCLHFTQNTTFHGINKITENTPFPIRRVLWVFIIMGGLSLFLTQMVQSIMHYLDYPVTVNTKIIYTKALPFPAVTICNQNVFRMSEAAAHGHYGLIDNIYSHDSITDVNLTSAELNVTIMDLYNVTAHNKYDMIISCVWDRGQCTADDFETTITEAGVCFTFNGWNTEEPRVASQTGSDRGLQLKLNIEQYEYMRGPNSAAGVKILVHDRAEVPFVRDFGQAISPGSHAFVGIQKTEITNLEPPYGECEREMDLQFFRNYTIPNCLVDCLANFLRKTCRCRLPHMPEFFSYPGEPVVCTLRKLQTCVEPQKKRFEEAQKSEELETDKCRCPVPCERSKYETDISYGMMSHIGNSKEGPHHDIHERFIKARETLQRVDPQIVENDVAIVRALEEAQTEVALTFEDILHKMKNVTRFVNSIMFHMDHRIRFHQEQALKAVEQAVLYGFVQPFDIDQQNYFEPLSTGSKQLLKRYRKALDKMLNITTRDMVDLRRVLLWQVEEDLSTRLDLATKSLESLEKVHESILDGEALLPYNWSIARRYDKKCVPRNLLRHNVDYQNTIYMFLSGNMKTICAAIKELRHMAKHAFKMNEYNETLFHVIRRDYMESIKSINYGHNLFKEAIVYKTKNLISKRISTFTKQVEALRRERSDVNITVQNILNLINNMKNNIWPALVRILDISEAYNLNKTHSKTALAEIVTSQDLDFHTQQAEDFFSDVRARARNFDHDWLKFRDALITVWKGIKSESTTRDFYAQISMDFYQIFNTKREDVKQKLLEPFNETLGEDDPVELFYMTNADMINMDPMSHVAAKLGNFDRFREDNDLIKVMNGKDDMFLHALNSWESTLRAFTEGSRIDLTFFRDNFLEVDVYMTELYYELVEQRVAYDLTHLWSNECTEQLSWLSYTLLVMVLLHQSLLSVFEFSHYSREGASGALVTRAAHNSGTGDIGGSMGLFVGASVITVFELLDAILHNFLKVQLQETKQRRRSMAIARSQSERSKQSNEQNQNGTKQGI